MTMPQEVANLMIDHHIPVHAEVREVRHSARPSIKVDEDVSPDSAGVLALGVRGRSTEPVDSRGHGKPDPQVGTAAVGNPLEHVFLTGDPAAVVGEDRVDHRREFVRRERGDPVLDLNAVPLQ